MCIYIERELLAWSLWSLVQFLVIGALLTDFHTACGRHAVGRRVGEIEGFQTGAKTPFHRSTEEGVHHVSSTGVRVWGAWFAEVMSKSLDARKELRPLVERRSSRVQCRG